MHLHVRDGVITGGADIGQTICGAGRKIRLQHRHKGIRAPGVGRVHRRDVEGGVAGRAGQDNPAVGYGDPRHVAAGRTQIPHRSQARPPVNVGRIVADHHPTAFNPGRVDRRAIGRHGLDAVVAGGPELVD